MATVLSSLGREFLQPELSAQLETAGALLRALIPTDAYVGEVYSLGYEEALVQIHDHHRRLVGGIPALSFLVATRAIGATVDVREEDSSVILLRVRVENAQRVSGEPERTWDHRDVMDPTTHHLLSYAGVKCRVLGTFYVSEVARATPS